MKFSFIAKHPGIWPADWMCGALGVSRGGFYAWLAHFENAFGDLLNQLRLERFSPFNRHINTVDGNAL